MIEITKLIDIFPIIYPRKSIYNYNNQETILPSENIDILCVIRGKGRERERGKIMLINNRKFHYAIHSTYVYHRLIFTVAGLAPFSNSTTCELVLATWVGNILLDYVLYSHHNFFFCSFPPKKHINFSSHFLFSFVVAKKSFIFFSLSNQIRYDTLFFDTHNKYIWQSTNQLLTM